MPITMKEEVPEASVAEQILAGFVHATRVLSAASAARNHKHKATLVENEELQVALAVSKGETVTLENSLSAARLHTQGLEEKLGRVRVECRVEAAGRLAEKKVEHEHAVAAHMAEHARVVKEAEGRLAKVKSVLRTRAEHDGKRIDTLQAEAEGLRQRLVQTDAAHEKDVARLTEAYNGAVGKHAFEIAEREKSVQALVREAHEKGERARVLDVSVANAGHETVLLRARKEFDAVRAEHRSVMAAASRAHETKLSGVMNSVRSQHAFAMEAASREQETKLSEVVNTGRRDVQRMRKELDTLRSQHASAMEAAASAHETKLADVCLGVQRANGESRAQHASAMEAAHARVKAVEDAAATEVHALTAAHASAMEAAFKGAAGNLEFATARHEKSLQSELKQAYENAERKSATAHAEYTAELEAKRNETSIMEKMMSKVVDTARDQAAEHASQMEACTLALSEAKATLELERTQHEQATSDAIPVEGRPKRKRSAVQYYK